ncbi:MAG TPA: S41 family peptidase [Dyadobacter sp.]|jgi:carboxyl-terminal processing protease|nr:S41 family peptidase [Dyadobacter sp.]
MINIKQINKLLFILVLAVFSACKKDDVEPDENTTSGSDYQAVNTWIYEMMNDAYFWYKEMPAGTTLDAKSDPTDYFEKLVYQRTTTDRFSMVVEDANELQNSFDGISKIFGISYSISYIDEGSSNVGLFLNYVVNGSPAASAGLKRGDIILKANGTQLTRENYSTLLSGSDTLTFTLGTVSGTTISAGSTTVSLTKAVVTEDPVAFSTVIDKSTYGKKIGYVVYTQFVPGVEGNDAKYDNELRQIFADFKTQGVNELVLDLRLNSGGYISSAKTLASLIGKNVSANKVFYKEQWNDKYVAYWQKQFGSSALDYPFSNEANNIGGNISRVFVLTSQGTASASELVINGLKPYMDVITIGDHTAGKNLFGSLISDDEDRWKWGIYLMLGQTANANGESDYGTINGMAPTHQVADNLLPYKPFADDAEPLFGKALELMGIPNNNTARITTGRKASAVVAGSFKDNLQVSESRMIKTSLKEK